MNLLFSFNISYNNICCLLIVYKTDRSEIGIYRVRQSNIKRASGHTHETPLDTFICVVLVRQKFEPTLALGKMLYGFCEVVFVIGCTLCDMS